jgi:hypothetical protein
MFEGKYTTMGSRSTLHPRVAKQQLNQHLGEVLAPVSDEIKDAFELHLPKRKGMFSLFCYFSGSISNVPSQIGRS